MDVKMTGAKLKRLREKHDVSQADVARFLEYDYEGKPDRSMIAKFEGGHALISPRIGKLLNFYFKYECPSPSAHRKAGERDALLNPDWRYIEPCSMDDYSRGDWADMNQQRAVYMGEQRAKQALEMLTASRDAPTFGYLINNYEHCLQTATMLHQDGHDEDTIVTGLFHDVGFIVCPENHGRFAADLIRPFVSEKNIWMLEYHEIFQRIHLHGFYQPEDPDFINEREQWRGHLYFDWTAEFIERYDIVAINPSIENLPIEFFEPMVRRVFSGSPSVT
jgi:predicted HD phosphohydrolase